MASTYLTRTVSSAGNRRTFTISFWVKRCTLGSQQAIFSAGASASSYLNFLGFTPDDYLNYWEYSNSTTGLFDLQTTRRFRDTSGWYHIVVAVDTTQATASDRVKYYINGVQETTFNSPYNTYPSQNQELTFNNNTGHYVGRYGYSSSNYFDGLLSHFHFIDGTAYAASDFGETDSTTGEWKIKTNVSVTYGTNGFFILKDGNSVTDQSSNTNNFTVSGGTLVNTEDCPSNVFCTLNNQYPHTTTGAFLYGNTGPQSYNSSQGIMGTLGAKSGKFYYEVKITGSSGENGMVGWGARDNTADVGYPGQYAYDWARYNNTTSYYNNGTETQISGSSAYTANDICGCAIDLDNNKIYWYKNGVLENTGGTTITDPDIAGYYYPLVRTGNGNHIVCNFGNGAFANTAITSEGTNASGNGKFEYDVPSGFTALSTKGLNE